jgi:hypothetical protein
MELERTHTNEISPLAYPPPERPATRTPKRKSLRGEARRRRILANLFFVCSSAVVIAVVTICYALLRE